MRIAFRWEVLDAENRSIKEHYAKRKVAHTRTEKEFVGEWRLERMANGETKPQIMARSRHIILMHKSKWNAQQQARAEALFRTDPFFIGTQRHGNTEVVFFSKNCLYTFTV